MSFDLLAPHYNWMETVLAGARLQRCRTAWLDELAGCRRVLVAGVGHGRALPEMLRRFPAARLTCVDASAAMLEVARARLAEAGVGSHRVAFVHATLPEWTPPAAAFDGIVTDFFLDCFSPDELRRVVAGLATAATAEARWLVADFAVPPHGAARWRAQAVHRLMYAFFRLATRLPARRLTEPDTWLAAEGFTLAHRRTAEWGLLRADCWKRGPAAGIAPAIAPP